MARTHSQAANAATTPAAGRGLGLSLLVIATAQLMLVLDDTVANIALPSIQRELAVSAATLPWIINAYILAFGGLLLFGGRVGDLFGRRRVVQIRMAVFTLASLLGGLAPNAPLLIAARGLQGLGAALTAPNVLALIATTFPAGTLRNRAMAVYGAMSAVGIIAGVLVGGFLTGALGWRWVFLINIPIGLAVLAGTRTLVEGQRTVGRLNSVDAMSGVGAILALAYGITRGGEHGWTDRLTLGMGAAAIVLLGVFLVLQARRADPMLPLRLFHNRNRSGSYATILIIGAGLMATFYLVTLYLQQVMQFSPIKTGLSVLPFGAGIIVASGLSSKLVERFAPRALAVPGLLLAALGMGWLSLLTVDAAYATHVLPAVFMTSFGLGLSFVPLTLTGVHGVADTEAGVASAVINTAQQLGAALGLAVFTTIATTAAARRLPSAVRTIQEGLAATDPSIVETVRAALGYGYTMAFRAGAGLFVLAALVVLVTVTTARMPGMAGSTIHH